jgi:hypothetical protein
MIYSIKNKFVRELFNLTYYGFSFLILIIINGCTQTEITILTAQEQSEFCENARSRAGIAEAKSERLWNPKVGSQDYINRNQNPGAYSYEMEKSYEESKDLKNSVVYWCNKVKPGMKLKKTYKNGSTTYEIQDE